MLTSLPSIPLSIHNCLSGSKLSHDKVAHGRKNELMLSCCNAFHIHYHL